jgi:phosphoribosyl 1,2-cyclic phosphodiesterase
MPQIGGQQLPLFAHFAGDEASGSGVSGPARGSTRRRPALANRLRMSVLGSGSGGNSTVVRSGRSAFLIDAGFGPRTTEKRLNQAGLGLADIEAICVTHLDRDHFRESWTTAALELGITVYLHHWHLSELATLAGGAALLQEGGVEPIDERPFQPVPGLEVSAIRMQHDLQGTLAYRVTDGAAAVGYATDLGHAPRSLVEHFAGVDVLCIEANYDPHMTARSSRPTFVIRRNLSTSGHLSNRQALAAVQAIEAASPIGRPHGVVLLHRSQQCNHPTTLRRVFEQDRFLHPRILLTQQRRRSRWVEVRPLPRMQRQQLRLR